MSCPRIYSDLNVLANLDENTYDGGINGSNHPIVWYHDFDGGRSFYTGGGHEDAAAAVVISQRTPHEQQ